MSIIYCILYENFIYHSILCRVGYIFDLLMHTCKQYLFICIHTCIYGTYTIYSTVVYSVEYTYIYLLFFHLYTVRIYLYVY